MAKKQIKGRITIDRETCKGCYLCMSVCPQGRITISKALNRKGYYPAEFTEKPKKDGKTCVACAVCATMCPDVAIEVYRD